MTPAIERLRRDRPRSLLVRGSLALLLLLAAYSWAAGDIDVGDLLQARRLENLRRFLREDVIPFPLRGRPVTTGGLLDWAGGLLGSRGLEGAAKTLAISVLAIALAALAGAGIAPFAARNVASHDPFATASGPGREPLRRFGWRLVAGTARALLILLRAVPEYVWAFLLLAMLGPSAWPAVLALAIHNAGILAKLGAETIENLDAAPLAALRDLGAGRRQVSLLAAAPLSLPRFLLYFFYRFETCVREATVLGLLGVVSLGYWIQDARARHYYDEMLFFVALGASIVLLGDLVSAAARAWVRRSA